MPQLGQARVEFVPCHCRHMDVSDQAGSLVETARCEKIGCRRESLDGVTQRPQKSSHRIAKEFIVFDDRDQWRFGQAGLPQSRTDIPVLATSNTVAPASELASCAKKATVASVEPLNFGLYPTGAKRFVSAREYDKIGLGDTCEVSKYGF
jgi:hypothetical protein